jgi:glycosyltransferase involved in cell wall biosynthesis
MKPDMKNNASVEVLLSTYNGEKYLEEQIDSIVGQSHSDWRLLIRDDGSKDGTVEIIKNYGDKYPEKMIVVESEGNIGVIKSFETLCRSATADYLMFCDQDDVWLPTKIERSLSHLLALENKYGSQKPLLVFSDMIVTDESLKTICDSFWFYSDLNPENVGLNKLLMKNVAAGCSMIFNRALLNMALPIPTDAIMHDYWFMLVAASFGRISHFDDKTVYYRQHSGNRIGAHEKWRQPFFKRIYSFARRLLRYRRDAFIERPYIRQAESLARSCGAKMHERTRRMLTDFVSLSDYPFLRRKYAILKHRFLPFDFIRNMDFLIRL